MLDIHLFHLLAVSAEWANFWVLCCYTIVTVALVITSVWAEPIRNKLWAPKLQISISDLHGFLTKRNNGQLTRYFHISVRNKRPSMPARSVRVECNSFTKITPDGETTQRLPFPLQLCWKIPQLHARYPDIALEDHCDLGHLDKGEDAFRFEFYESPNNFDTSVRVSERARVTLRVMADNRASTPEATFEVAWDGQWFDGDAEMDSHLRVREVSDSRAKRRNFGPRSLANALFGRRNRGTHTPQRGSAMTNGENDPKEPDWYRQALYEQSWENYRNEDDNYRSATTHYLIFAATIAGIASQAPKATFGLALLGLLVSIVTLFYLGRITRYSQRWLVSKADASGSDLDQSERNHMETATKRLGWFARVSSVIPGYFLNQVFPLAGAVFFIYMLCRGADFWQ